MKYLRTKEIREKQSNTMKLKYSQGYVNPMTNTHRIGSEAPNWKGGLPRCKICDKLLSRHNAIYCNKHQKRVGVSRPGALNPNWKGGSTFKFYPLGWSKTFKEQIRFRDQYKCQNCGVPEVECNTKLHVHHIDYNKKNINPDNLISLCNNCHAKTTVTKKEKKDFWITYYKKSD